MRLKEYEDTYGEKLSCKCALCAESKGNVEKFLEGDPRILLAKSKTHDHFAQRAELEKAQDRIREGKFGDYVKRKRFAQEFRTAMQEMPKDEA